LAEQRSALVDGALSDADRERVLAHLVSCAPCRAEVAELSRLRRLLNAEAAGSTPPSDLSDRLVGIAGAQATGPSGHRQSVVSTAGWPPRGRRRPSRRVATALGTGAVALTVVTVGLAAAPRDAALVPDPTGQAQAEFTSVSSVLPLGNDSLGAVLMASARAPNQGSGAPVASVTTGGRTSLDGTSALLPAAALSVLRRAAASVDLINYSGTQSFMAAVDGRSLTARIEIENHVGQGREVRVFDSDGHPAWESFVTPQASSRIADSGELSLLANNYVLTGFRGGSVAGRAATVVQAAEPTSARGPGAGPGPVAARWWVDDASGLLLRYEAYDEAGTPTLSAGFTRVSVGHTPFLEHLPPRLAVPVTTFSRTLSSVGQLAATGWACPDEIGGLSLVRVRTDAPVIPRVLHLAYSDGLSTVSVFEQRGTLSASPASSRWDPALRAYVTSTAPSVAIWQSNRTVFTVVTDGSADVLARAVGGLPHDPVPRPTTIERVGAGWARILSSVMG